MLSTVHVSSPRYLTDHVTAYDPDRSLHSADQTIVVVPRINLERFGRQTFSCARKDLKTVLFKHTFTYLFTSFCV